MTQKKGGILLYIITNANACIAARQTATSSLHLLLSPRLVVRAAVRGLCFSVFFRVPLAFYVQFNFGEVRLGVAPGGAAVFARTGFNHLLDGV